MCAGFLKLASCIAPKTFRKAIMFSSDYGKAYWAYVARETSWGNSNKPPEEVKPYFVNLMCG